MHVGPRDSNQACYAAIDLDQLAEAGPAAAGLVKLGVAQLARYPDAGVHHHATNRFLCQADPMNLAELLAREGRPEVRVKALDQAGDVGLNVAGDPVVTSPATMLRKEPQGALGAIPGHQAPKLTVGYLQTPRRRPGLQHPVQDRLNALQSIQLAHAQRNEPVLGLHRGGCGQPDRLDTT